MIEKWVLIAGLYIGVIALLLFVFNRGQASNWHTSYVSGVGYVTTNEARP